MEVVKKPRKPYTKSGKPKKKRADYFVYNGVNYIKGKQKYNDIVQIKRLVPVINFSGDGTNALIPEDVFKDYIGRGYVYDKTGMIFIPPEHETEVQPVEPELMAPMEIEPQKNILPIVPEPKVIKMLTIPEETEVKEPPPKPVEKPVPVVSQISEIPFHHKPHEETDVKSFEYIDPNLIYGQCEDNILQCKQKLDRAKKTQQDNMKVLERYLDEVKRKKIKGARLVDFLQSHPLYTGTDILDISETSEYVFKHMTKSTSKSSRFMKTPTSDLFTGMKPISPRGLLDLEATSLSPRNITKHKKPTFKSETESSVYYEPYRQEQRRIPRDITFKNLEKSMNED